jgi:hypothetical protein
LRRGDELVGVGHDHTGRREGRCDEVDRVHFVWVGSVCTAHHRTEVPIDPDLS